MFILTLLVIWVVWKLCMVGIRLTWGILRFLCSIILFPAIVFGLVAAGLLYLALPVVLVVAFIAVIAGALGRNTVESPNV